MQDTRVPIDRATIMTTIVSTLENLVQDWDIEEPITSKTRVVADLGFESIDLIQMVAALEHAFRLKGSSLVAMLVVDGRYVDDLTVEQVTDDVERRIGKMA